MATAVGVAAISGLLVSACAAPDDHTNHGSTPSSSAMSDHDGMSGMGPMAGGDGLTAESAGFRFAPTVTSMPAGQPVAFGFRIVDAGGKPVTTFEPDQTKLMHFYLVRSDLTGFQHVHPAMTDDGTWTAPLRPAEPGSYRAYSSFVTSDAAGKAVPLVLSEQITVPGAAATTPLPAASRTAGADGYTLNLAGEQLMADMSHELTVTVSKDGQPVTDLQPYLDTYAHLTAFHERDLAFAHLHPHGTVNGDHGGPALTFEATLPESGNWRLFIQFQTGGVLHTAAVTVRVG